MIHFIDINEELPELEPLRKLDSRTSLLVNAEGKPSFTYYAGFITTMPSDFCLIVRSSEDKIVYVLRHTSPELRGDTITFRIGLRTVVEEVILALAAETLHRRRHAGIPFGNLSFLRPDALQMITTSSSSPVTLPDPTSESTDPR